MAASSLSRAAADFGVKLTPYERLLYHGLPTMLRGCGCSGAARDLVEVLQADEADEARLAEALAAAADSALTLAAAGRLDVELAARAEAVSCVARHLFEHETSVAVAPMTAMLHLARALDLALALGHPVGPVLVRSRPELEPVAQASFEFASEPVDAAEPEPAEPECECEGDGGYQHDQACPLSRHDSGARPWS